MRRGLGDVLTLAGRGSTGLFIGLNVLAGIGLTVLSVVYLVDGRVGAAVALFFLGLPLMSGLLYLAGMVVSVPLLWAGAKLNPESEYWPEH